MSTGLLKLNSKLGRKNLVDASFSFHSYLNQHLISTYDKAGILENICKIYREIVVPSKDRLVADKYSVPLSGVYREGEVDSQGKQEQFACVGGMERLWKR